ncbi:actin-like ATPase domain-containing protein, partial [Wilcoxina mikolae CBS 423.85]
MAPPKKSGRTLLKEEGLERTDNNLRNHSWPVIPMINQKNYYTEYLKRDDQIMVLREQQEEVLRAQAAALEKGRENPGDPTAMALTGDSMAIDEQKVPDEVAEEEEVARYGSKIIVIHPGSQNLRLGFASDALPKSIPNVIARRAEKAEFEVEERCPKRVKLDADGDVDMVDDEDEEVVGVVEKDREFDARISAMSTELKQKMRSNKRRMLPNSKELVLSYNRRTVPETIKEHNDPYRVEWTEVSKENPKEYYVGQEALRIPDTSTPRYKLLWPIRYGWLNEKDYTSKRRLLEDIQIIIEEGIKNELGLEKKELGNYRAVLVVPDLYERSYVTDMVEMLMKEVRFAEICIIQESVAASFGAGFSQACIVDVGAQKTSICCVDEGMCVMESRVNLKYGGQDITELFFRLILQNSFPYKSINLWRRYDFLLAEELKLKLTSLADGDVTVANHDFHLRRPDKDTKKYTFRIYDEIYLAPKSHFNPTITDHSHKLAGRRSLWERSYDIYDNMPNDPMSTAQAAIYQSLSSKLTEVANSAPEPPVPRPFGAHLNPAEITPRSSVAGSPGPELATPVPGIATPSGQGEITANGSIAGGVSAASGGLSPRQVAMRMWEEYDKVVPIIPLDKAVMDSISHAAKGDEKKMRDFFAGIMVVGGGGAVPGFRDALEEKIRIELGRDMQILIGVPPRELDMQVIAW